MRRKGPGSKNEILRLVIDRTLGGATSRLARSLLPRARVEVVDQVALDRYLGRWFEIASFPQWFQRGCVASMATYTRRDDGRIRVVNECRDGSFDGKLRRADGVAWVADEEESGAKLNVQFRPEHQYLVAVNERGVLIGGIYLSGGAKLSNLPNRKDC